MKRVFFASPLFKLFVSTNAPSSFHCQRRDCPPLFKVQTLEIRYCPSLLSLPKQCLPTSLETLEIFKCPELLSLPEKGLPTSLQTLEISWCPNLVSLPKEGLPTSLQTLYIYFCPKLESLPGEGLSTSLSTRSGWLSIANTTSRKREGNTSPILLISPPYWLMVTLSLETCSYRWRNQKLTTDRYQELCHVYSRFTCNDPYFFDSWKWKISCLNSKSSDSSSS